MVLKQFSDCLAFLLNKIYTIFGIQSGSNEYTPMTNESTPHQPDSDLNSVNVIDDQELPGSTIVNIPNDDKVSYFEKFSSNESIPNLYRDAQNDGLKFTQVEPIISTPKDHESKTSGSISLGIIDDSEPSSVGYTVPSVEDAHLSSSNFPHHNNNLIDSRKIISEPLLCEFNYSDKSADHSHSDVSFVKNNVTDTNLSSSSVKVIPETSIEDPNRETYQLGHDIDVPEDQTMYYSAVSFQSSEKPQSDHDTFVSPYSMSLNASQLELVRSSQKPVEDIFQSSISLEEKSTFPSISTENIETHISEKLSQHSYEYTPTLSVEEKLDLIEEKAVIPDEEDIVQESVQASYEHKRSISVEELVKPDYENKTSVSVEESVIRSYEHEPSLSIDEKLDSIEEKPIVTSKEDIVKELVKESSEHKPSLSVEEKLDLIEEKSDVTTTEEPVKPIHEHKPSLSVEEKLDLIEEKTDVTTIEEPVKPIHEHKTSLSVEEKLDLIEEKVDVTTTEGPVERIHEHKPSLSVEEKLDLIEKAEILAKEEVIQESLHESYNQKQSITAEEKLDLIEEKAQIGAKESELGSEIDFPSQIPKPDNISEPITEEVSDKKMQVLVDKLIEEKETPPFEPDEESFEKKTDEIHSELPSIQEPKQETTPPDATVVEENEEPKKETPKATVTRSKSEKINSLLGKMGPINLAGFGGPPPKGGIRIVKKAPEPVEESEDIQSEAKSEKGEVNLRRLPSLTLGRVRKPRTSRPPSQFNRTSQNLSPNDISEPYETEEPQESSVKSAEESQIKDDPQSSSVEHE